MRVLHYTLGWPPQRTGGLTNYAVDLMECEKKQGINVINLFPGNYSPISLSPKIIKSKTRYDTPSYILKNSLPLVLKKSIKNPKSFMVSASIDYFRSFLKSVNPDIIHVHTLMGLYKEFLLAAKQLKIPLIYTTHDYFGLAPNPTFYNEFTQKSFHTTNSVQDWLDCSFDSYPTWKLRIFQTDIYPLIRRNIKHISRNKDFNSIEVTSKNEPFHSFSHKKWNEFSELKLYYQSLFKLFDIFLYNSNVSKYVFESNLGFLVKGKVITIANKSIKFSSTTISPESINSNQTVRIGYIGAYSPQKGFNYLIDNFNKLEKNKFELHLFGDNVLIDNLPVNIINHGKYKRQDLEDIYSTFDILVIPSRWMETFGFTALEALTFNKTVLISNNAGASQLFKNKNCFKPVKDELIKKLNELREYPERFSESLDIPESILNITKHTDRIINEYNSFFS